MNEFVNFTDPLDRFAYAYGGASMIGIIVLLTIDALETAFRRFGKNEKKRPKQ